MSTPDVDPNQVVSAFRCERCGAEPFVGYQLEAHLKREHDVAIPMGGDWSVQTYTLGGVMARLEPDR